MQLVCWWLYHKCLSSFIWNSVFVIYVYCYSLKTYKYFIYLLSEMIPTVQHPRLASQNNSSTRTNVCQRNYKCMNMGTFLWKLKEKNCQGSSNDAIKAWIDLFVSPVSTCSLRSRKSRNCKWANYKDYSCSSSPDQRNSALVSRIGR